jgi:hypothetical protein
MGDADRWLPLWGSPIRPRPGVAIGGPFEGESAVPGSGHGSVDGRSPPRAAWVEAMRVRALERDRSGSDGHHPVPGLWRTWTQEGEITCVHGGTWTRRKWE